MTTSASWIGSLRVPGDEALPPACTEATVAPIRALVGDNAVNWAVRVAAEAALNPLIGPAELPGRGPLTSSQRLGVEFGFLSILESLYRGKPTPPFLNADGNRYIADLIQRRIPLARLLTQIRQGHAYIAEQLMKACQDLLPANEHAEQLQRISRVLFEYFEGLVTEVEPAFKAAETEWGASVYAARAKALESLLQGDETELDDAGRRLSYDIAHRYHVGIAISNETPDESDAHLVEAAHHVLAVLGARQTLVVPRGVMMLWAWGNSSSRLDVRLLQEFNGLKILVGRVGYGPAGFRRSHEQALEAHRIGQQHRKSVPSLLLFDDISLLSLLLKNPGEAAEFVAFELGDLMKDDPKTADLRLTLRTYLENRSPNTTAAKLHVARNTVTYRLRRASEILGRPLDKRQVETWTALLLHEYTSAPPQFK
jgi:DNA-binding PucR family transcriptional regulator